MKNQKINYRGKLQFKEIGIAFLRAKASLFGCTEWSRKKLHKV